jgi:hypothetical protein
MRFNEWIDKKHPEFNEGVISMAVYAFLQTLWQYYGGPEMSHVDQFMNYAIHAITNKFRLAEPQAAAIVKQFMCKVGYC